MTRIANLSASEHLIGILARTQSRVQDLQTQVATGKRSQTYAGIAGNARDLLGLEKGRQMLDRFDRNNDSMKTGLDATTTVVDGIGETLRTLRQTLNFCVVRKAAGRAADERSATGGVPGDAGHAKLPEHRCRWPASVCRQPRADAARFPPGLDARG